MAKKAADRRHRARHAAWTEALATPERDEAADIGRHQRTKNALVDRPALVLAQEGNEAAEIVAIGTQRVRAGAPLMGERGNPLLLQSFGRSSHARILRSKARAKKPRSASASSPSKRSGSRAPSA